MGRGLSDQQKFILAELNGKGWVIKRKFVAKLKPVLYPNVYMRVEPMIGRAYTKQKRRVRHRGANIGYAEYKDGKLVEADYYQHLNELNAVSVAISRAVSSLISRGLVEERFLDFSILHIPSRRDIRLKVDVIPMEH